MSALKTAVKLIKTPGKMVAPLAQKGFFDWMSDEAFLKLRFRAEMGYKLNLKNPRTYNEKLQWLKLYDRKPEYGKMVDKYAVKDYVAELIGEEYVIPLLGVYDTFEEIDFDALPGQFVLKCTHDSGSFYICRDKDRLDKKQAATILKRGLKRKTMRYAREWPYSLVKPRIIAEAYMEDEAHEDLTDYKIFTFGGETAMILVNTGRFGSRRHCLYSPRWELLAVSPENADEMQESMARPDNLDKMMELAKVLSQKLPHVRVDFYSINGQIYFGELTFYHRGGFGKFPPLEMGTWLGDLLVLPKAVSQQGEEV